MTQIILNILSTLYPVQSFLTWSSGITYPSLIGPIYNQGRESGGLGCYEHVLLHLTQIDFVYFSGSRKLIKLKSYFGPYTIPVFFRLR